MTSPVLVWLRQDLRLHDNPALYHASKVGPVVACYCLDDETPGPWALGGASRWWLHHSLSHLKQALAERGIPLILRRGKGETVIHDLVSSLQPQAIYWNRCYEPYAINRDSLLKAQLKKQGITVQSFNGSLLIEPWEVAPSSGPYYKVFTPYWRACQAHIEIGSVLPLPPKQKIKIACDSEDLDAWQLLPTRPDWASGFKQIWTPGEAGATKQLKDFLQTSLDSYAKERDLPGKAHTSRLSPHLHFGELSPQQVWRAVISTEGRGKESYLSELGWREFSYHLLFHFPKLPSTPFQEKFSGFSWKRSSSALERWQKGQTGYPIVDAGMRELWTTGWMHNRVRMIVASFLTKDLLLHWKHGEAWFWDTLVDADLANNSASWQWVAGCGADAAPYFRIFNPVLQGQRFDPEGTYVKHWCPELSHLPLKWLHQPWEAPKEALRQAGVVLGRDYPLPIVDHSSAKEEALARYAALSPAGAAS